MTEAFGSSPPSASTTVTDTSTRSLLLLNAFGRGDADLDLERVVSLKRVPVAVPESQAALLDVMCCSSMYRSDPQRGPAATRPSTPTSATAAPSNECVTVAGRIVSLPRWSRRGGSLMTAVS